MKDPNETRKSFAQLLRIEKKEEADRMKVLETRLQEMLLLLMTQAQINDEFRLALKEMREKIK